MTTPACCTMADRTTACRIVGLGASAGGLEALEEFFQHIPEAPGCAFVLVMHLDPHHKPLLAELLTRHTHLQALQAEDGMPVAANHIYVIPPNSLLTQENGVLQLTRTPVRRNMRHPIDDYFASLARDCKDAAVGVVFSGAGNDGAVGLKEIGVAGGIAMVQEPATARFDSMPLSALAAGAADVVLPPAQLAERLMALLRRTTPTSLEAAAASSAEASPPDPSLDTVLSPMLIRLEQSTGLAFTNYKRTTLLRRIDKRMRLRDVNSLVEYRDLLDQELEEAMALARELSVSVTSFFRDADVFAALEQDVLPELFAPGKETEDLRIWVPGCASGEEAYSIAILLQEYMRRHAVRKKISMFATDMDDAAIARARTGVYPQSTVNDLPGTLLHRYFLFQNGDYAVSSILRKMIVFARHDLFATPPFSRLDLISCRNLLIYLTPQAQGMLLPLFHHSLRSGGHLVLGVAESLGEHARLFEPVHAKWKIYRRREVPTPTAEYPFMLKSAPLDESTFKKLAAAPPRPDVPQLFQQALLKTFAPPSLLVDERDTILHMEGDLSPFLELPQGRFSNEAVRLVRPPLRLPLRNALRQARRQKTLVVAHGISLSDRPQTVVEVQVHPMQEEYCQESCLLVAFVERLRPTNTRESGVDFESACCEAHDELITRLEEELRITGEQLRLAVQDLEASNQELMASNEELLSMNEELQSSNEELETSQEELQALNEELTSVNTELQANIQALDRSKSDMENLLRATDIATVFLDCQLIIRQFTPAASAMFHVLESDVGRPLEHFANRLQGLDVPAMAATVQETRQRMECLVHSDNSADAERRTYLSRMFPYCSTAGEMDGLVLTFVDITERQRMEDELRSHRDELERLVAERTTQLAERSAQLRTLLDHFPNGSVLLFDQDLRYLVAAGEAMHIMGIASSDLEGKTLYDLQADGVVEALEPVYRQALAGEGSRQDAEFRGQIFDVWVLPVRSDAGAVIAGMVMTQLVTEQRRIQREFAESLDRFKKSFRASPAFMLISTLEEGRIVEVNDALCAMTGHSRHDLIGRTSLAMGILPSVEERETFVRALKACGSLTQQELRIGTRQGTILSTIISAELIELEGKPHILTAGMDLSERIHREKQLQAVMDHVPAAVWIAHDPQCATMEGSRAALELLRVAPGANPSKSALYNPPVHFQVFKDGRELLPHELPMQQAALLGLSLHEEELDIVFEDGEVRHIMGNAVPLLDRDGRVTGAVGAFLDITERAQMERRLEEARALAEEANRAKTAFLANMSHELRTPLNGIMGMAQLVQISTLEQELQEQANMIIEASRHLQSIIDDLMDISQIESNQIKIRPSKTSVREILHRLMAMHQPEAERKGLALRCRIDDDVPTAIQVDGKRISQILNNLMNNALKFTETGQIEVHVHTADGGETPRLRVAVQDTGIGIHASQHEAIFKTFYQVEQNLTRSSQGTGLGLSISQRLAELMGGGIRLESVPGRGSLFTLDLPCQVSPTEHAPLPPVMDPNQLGTQGLHVLVVEDNSVSRLFMTTMLKKSGCTVDEATDGLEAVEQVRSTPYDAVFMDIQMPRLNGLDATRMLRADEDPRVRACCIIALTAYAMPEDKQQFLDAGMDSFLSKPVTFQELHAALHAALEHRENANR
ncbi:CheR family methyltransferase [Megalodesulfovibrio gigas]|uniref:histidine kinase n=1 Tax=Megalodesulfovibrio gigas (strain ATCC 19364 / DSM 1382 / NCIMB 9332 / VKM B-1759) TaxID=1121448 RepID=T2GDR3_MEGG1|nr:CheR family methyltransferase [Megalodesulfovibrio gigas]AGW14443.1 putative MCP methyltransferase/methylesterase [Megalodesulfovibrio gigas DSM 1382 = ATCC 19364]